MKNTILFLALMMIFTAYAVGQEKLELYTDGLPNAKEKVDLGDNLPELYFYKPTEIKHKITFLIIPGGGYSHVAIKHEGHDVAKALADQGFPAFVLRYRLPKADQMLDKRTGAIQDAQQALSYIRSYSISLGIEQGKVGVLGFSAGGHLASTLSTHFDTDYLDKGRSSVTLRPDFSVLLYPVISMNDDITHKGSKKNLIGPDFLQSDVDRFSNELNVTKNTPPAYLMHAVDDKVVPIENAERYRNSLQKNGVACKLFVYDTGGHGFGLVNKTDARSWFDDMIVWLNDLKF
ncbi:alpha/beta hydrolase [Sphingobacterium pedocola]|uniref:Alpha/beta hydrolase n=1 Tax=Sphingobacterium pedocola TaxID=2082722 RepID=A0ABR9TBD2_9SPHI|nr:alpha/beta hydrolase [Sphingobacterium pedocola]MBE8722184.1 alpha/beta hydrolase [Sphingobacterium pedocola]